MGNLLLAAEYVDAAEPCYQNAQMLAPGDARWPYYLGHVYRTRGEPAKAARAFEQALAIGPPDVATLVWLGVAYLDQGKPSAAAPLFARALAIEPRSVAALFGQGRAALASRDYGRAAESFEQALSIDARASMVHYPLALAYRGLGEMDKAEAQARQRGDVEVGPSDPRMQALALLLHSATSYEKRGLRALDGARLGRRGSCVRQGRRARAGECDAASSPGDGACRCAGDTRGAVAAVSRSASSGRRTMRRRTSASGCCWPPPAATPKPSNAFVPPFATSPKTRTRACSWPQRW